MTISSNKFFDFIDIFIWKIKTLHSVSHKLIQGTWIYEFNTFFPGICVIFWERFTAELE